MFSSEKAPSITQVVMNLPNDAVEFLGSFSFPRRKTATFLLLAANILSVLCVFNFLQTEAFRGILRGRTQDQEFPLPMIHVYGFSKARDPEFDFHEVWP